MINVAMNNYVHTYVSNIFVDKITRKKNVPVVEFLCSIIYPNF